MFPQDVACQIILKAVDVSHSYLQTQLSLTNRATRLEVSRGHQTWYHSIF